MIAGNNISPLFDRSGNLTPDAMQRYLSGNLSPAEREAVETHLESSPFDREALEGLRKHPAMNVGQVVAGLDAQIRQAALQKAAAAPKPVIHRYYWAAAAGLAGLVGLTVLLVFMFRAPSSQQLAVRSSQSEVSSPETETPNPDQSSVDSRQSSVDGRQLAVTEDAQKPVATTQEEATALNKPAVDNRNVGGIAIADEAKIATDDVSAQNPEPEARNPKSGIRNSESEVAESLTAVMPSEDTTRKTNAISAENIEPFLVVEQMPDFPGGEAELYKYLQKNIHYPDSAKINGIQGNVYVRFIVDNKGKISDVTLLRGIGGGCDEEAMRVVKEMPDWVPGKQNGKSVPVYFTLPIKFILQGK